MLKYTILFLLIFARFSVFSQNNKEFESFLNALASVESSNNPKAFNKAENAVGIYQIRPLYFKDAQKINPKLNKYTHKNCFDPKIAKMVVEAYLFKYSQKQTPEHWAKCHNGGLNYYKKTGQVKKNLEIYWGKIQKYLVLLVAK